MTGNATVRGGGIGSLSPNEGMSVKLGKAPGVAHGKTFKPLLFSTHVSSQVHYDRARYAHPRNQLREDIKLLNGIDLGEDPRLHLEMFIKGAGSGDVFNQRAAINPKLEAWNKLTSVIAYDRFMSTTARYSDIIFPVVSHFEESFITGSRVKTDTNFVNQILDPMYECKTDWQINELIAQRLGINWGRDGKSDIDVMKIMGGAKVPEKYKELNPEFKLPTFEEMQKEGNVQLFVKPETSVIDTARFARENPNRYRQD